MNKELKLKLNTVKKKINRGRAPAAGAPVLDPPLEEKLLGPLKRSMISNSAEILLSLIRESRFEKTLGWVFSQDLDEDRVKTCSRKPSLNTIPASSPCNAFSSPVDVSANNSL